MIRRPPRSTLFPYRRSSDLSTSRFREACGQPETDIRRLVPGHGRLLGPQATPFRRCPDGPAPSRRNEAARKKSSVCWRKIFPDERTYDGTSHAERLLVRGPAPCGRNHPGQMLVHRFGSAGAFSGRGAVLGLEPDAAVVLLLQRSAHHLHQQIGRAHV